jgi:hypothetical protein
MKIPNTEAYTIMETLFSAAETNKVAVFTEQKMLDRIRACDEQALITELKRQTRDTLPPNMLNVLMPLYVAQAKYDVNTPDYKKFTQKIVKGAYKACEESYTRLGPVVIGLETKLSKEDAASAFEDIVGVYDNIPALLQALAPEKVFVSPDAKEAYTAAFKEFVTPLLAEKRAPIDIN